MNTTKFALYISLSIPLILASMGNIQAAKVYRWIDDKGQTHYSDRVPRQHIQKERHELNAQGITQSITNAARTPQQRAAEDRIKKEQAAQAKMIAESRQYDDMLLATFTTDEDLIRSRDGKINALEGSIRLTEASLKRLNKNLVALNKKTKVNKDKTSAHARKLSVAINDIETQVQQQKEYITRKRQEQTQIRAKFDKDITRFRFLLQQRDKRSH